MNTLMPYHVSHPIQVVSYDLRWPALFEEERVRLLAALAPTVLEIEHFGSTSVPGLPAKPILDLLAAVRRLEDVDPLTDSLGGLGYQDASLWLGGWVIPDRRLFCRGPYNEGTHHLHFAVLGSTPWVGNLRFRNLLRSDSEAAAEYARLKQGLAEAHGTDVDGYTEGKTEFVFSALGRE